MNYSDSRSPGKLDRTIQACIDNAERLYTETYDLEFRKPCATRYFLLIIAQEEAAKAFLLYLIKEDVVPLTSAVRRAINDHACKHLVGMIMDYMIMHWETIEELRELIRIDLGLGNNLPNDVGSALEILRYEKIGRWAANNRVWTEDPAYDRAATKLAEGKRDRRKQDALYVRIGSDGQIASTPTEITEAEVAIELQRTRRYVTFADALTTTEKRYGFDRDRFAKVIAALKLLFDPKNGPVAPR
ncbi:MAG TPA: AbiV family abortive infection protein [Stellaceae bacterium]|nr:AbiV family abortive infection protein [Stellaceae bacterium]